MRKVLDIMDKTLRDRAALCPTCSKPVTGVVRLGETSESAGLCVCDPFVLESDHWTSDTFAFEAKSALDELCNSLCGQFRINQSRARALVVDAIRNSLVQNEIADVVEYSLTGEVKFARNG